MCRKGDTVTESNRRYRMLYTKLVYATIKRVSVLSTETLSSPSLFSPKGMTIWINR